MQGTANDKRSKGSLKRITSADCRLQRNSTTKNSLIDCLLPIGSLHSPEAIEKFWFDGSTIVRIKKQPIRNPVIWRSLANQQLSHKKN